MEHEEGRESEKRDRERNDKKRQIHALKHPEEVSLYRKTLRSARRLFDGIRVDSHQQKDWKKPLTSKHGALKRHLSLKGTMSPGVRTPTEHSSPQKEHKQSNPLRFMMNPLSLVTEREDRLTERPQGSIEELDNANQRYSIHSQTSSRYAATAASTTWEDSISSSRNVRRRLSTASTPEPLSPRVDSDRGGSSPPISYERTQSVPVPPSLTSRGSELSSVYEAAPKLLETITEDTATATESATDQERYVLACFLGVLFSRLILPNSSIH